MKARGLNEEGTPGGGWERTLSPQGGGLWDRTSVREGERNISYKGVEIFSLADAF